jgi:hypothetical protein
MFLDAVEEQRNKPRPEVISLFGIPIHTTYDLVTVLVKADLFPPDTPLDIRLFPKQKKFLEQNGIPYSEDFLFGMFYIFAAPYVEGVAWLYAYNTLKEFLYDVPGAKFDPRPFITYQDLIEQYNYICDMHWELLNNRQIPVKVEWDKKWNEQKTPVVFQTVTPSGLMAFSLRGPDDLIPFHYWRLTQDDRQVFLDWLDERAEITVLGGTAVVTFYDLITELVYDRQKLFPRVGPLTEETRKDVLKSIKRMTLDEDEDVPNFDGNDILMFLDVFTAPPEDKKGKKSMEEEEEEEIFGVPPTKEELLRRLQLPGTPNAYEILCGDIRHWKTGSRAKKNSPMPYITYEWIQKTWSALQNYTERRAVRTFTSAYKEIDGKKIRVRASEPLFFAVPKDRTLYRQAILSTPLKNKDSRLAPNHELLELRNENDLVLLYMFCYYNEEKFRKWVYAYSKTALFPASTVLEEEQPVTDESMLLYTTETLGEDERFFEHSIYGLVDFLVSEKKFPEDLPIIAENFEDQAKALNQEIFLLSHRVTQNDLKIWFQPFVERSSKQKQDKTTKKRRGRQSKPKRRNVEIARSDVGGSGEGGFLASPPIDYNELFPPVEEEEEEEEEEQMQQEEKEEKEEEFDLDEWFADDFFGSDGCARDRRRRRFRKKNDASYRIARPKKKKTTV